MTRYEQALLDMTERHERERKNLIAAKEEIERYEALAAECKGLVCVQHLSDRVFVFMTHIYHGYYTGELGVLVRNAKLADPSSDNPIFAVEIDGHVFNVWWEG